MFNPPLWSVENGTLIDVIIDKFFSGLRRWDAIHFLHIARFGYIYETSLAFFPGYPLLLVRPLAYLFNQIFVEPNAYLFSSIFINFLLGFCNTSLLYQLGLKYHLNPTHAFLSAVLYIINPATVFFLAPYSETSFLTSQLLGHYFLQADQLFFSSLCFGFGASIRSNGIISLGFILHSYLKQIYQRKTLIFPFYNFLLCLSPFFLVQYYQYKEYCFEKILPLELQTYGLKENLPMPLSHFSSSWCSTSLPLSYQYVQRTHWNVGFFKYWTWKQIPNFILALPIFVFIGRFVRNWLLLIQADLRQEKFAYFFRHKNPSKQTVWFIEKAFLPHIIYTGFLTLFALLFMHIQVTTRFLFSSGPFLYWLSADRINEDQIAKRNLRKIFDLFKKETFLFYYYFIYVFLGLCLFVNFLPWT